MASLTRRAADVTAEDLPVLHLSGEVLGQALERLVQGAEAHGGIEVFSQALNLKTAVFQDTLGAAVDAGPDREAFERLCPLMATVRRRVGAGIERVGYPALRSAIAALLEGAGDTGSADARLEAFVSVFPAEKSFRWARDLGAEILHGALPEQYPLMSKWVWDARANTGVLREIWHGDNVDHQFIDVADGYATFLVLRQELSQYLADNGIFRDMLAYVDLLQAQVYADYINAQGGVYLRTDFASESDPLEHVRRILGLDGVSPKASRMRATTIEGAAESAGDTKRLT